MAFGTAKTVMTCTSELVVGECPIGSQQWERIYALDPNQAVYFEQLFGAGGIDWQIVVLASGACLAMFGAGIGTGLLVNIVRNLRRV